MNLEPSSVVVEMAVADFTTSEFDVFFNYRYLRYAEGARSLDLPIDPPEDGDSPAIIELPTAGRWCSEMPEWARDRRGSILERIRLRCSHMRCQWEEY